MATLSERLRDEYLRLSGRSIDRGCADSGIAANLSSEAADALDAMEAALRECKATCAPDWGALSDQIDAALAMVRK